MFYQWLEKKDPELHMYLEMGKKPKKAPDVITGREIALSGAGKPRGVEGRGGVHQDTRLKRKRTRAAQERSWKKDQGY